MGKAKLGDLVFDVITKEQVSDKAEVTDRPIEKGSDISDHHKPSPTRVDIKGAFTQQDAPKHLATLRQYYREARLLKFTHRNIFENAVIEILDTDHHKNNKLGFDFQFILKIIKLSEGKEFEIKAVNPVTKKVSKKTNTQVKRTTSKGRQQTKPRKLSSNAIQPSSKIRQKSSVVYRQTWNETMTPGNTITTILRTNNISELNRKQGKKYVLDKGRRPGSGGGTR